MRYLVDTNILVRHCCSEAPESDACDRAVDVLPETGNDLCICAQVLIEFWCVATRPREVNGLGMPTTDAQEAVSDLRDAFACVPEVPDIADRWSSVVGQYGVVGKQAHDARIAALMMAHGITHLLTLNPDDFARYTEITTVTPHQVA